MLKLSNNPPFANWSTGVLQANDGGVLLIEARPDEFLAVGSGLTVRISRDLDADARVGGIAGIEGDSRELPMRLLRVKA